MPKNKMKMKAVNKEIFMKVVHKSGSSIRKLGNVDRNIIQMTERTIRRSLNDGRMQECRIREIAKYLNVDPRLLTGEIYTQYKFYEWNPLEHLELYPYEREETDKLRSESTKKIISRVLSVFNRSYSQYKAKDVDEQYQFEIEIFESMFSIVAKYFPINIWGEENNYEDDASLILDLDYERKQLSEENNDREPSELEKEYAQKYPQEPKE